MRWLVTILLAAALSIVAIAVYADSHEVRYTPSNDAYGACRAKFPYSHLEDCARDYDTLMQFWLMYVDADGVTMYPSCNAAESAGEVRSVGSIGSDVGFPVAAVPGAANGDGDDRVCEQGVDAATPVETVTPSTVTPTATVAAIPSVTPTAAENLFSLLVCDRVRVNGSMYWGQAPGLIYSGDPRVSGQLQDGDYIRFLMSEPNDEGEIRIKVFPVDFREVGKTNDRVWIHWHMLITYRLDLHAFTCEL